MKLLAVLIAVAFSAQAFGKVPVKLTVWSVKETEPKDYAISTEDDGFAIPLKDTSFSCKVHFDSMDFIPELKGHFKTKIICTSEKLKTKVFGDTACGKKSETQKKLQPAFDAQVSFMENDKMQTIWLTCDPSVEKSK